MENKILATVGGVINITEGDVDAFIRALGQNGRSYDTPEGRRAILTQLISNKLLLLDARRNLYETEAEYKKELLRLKDELLINYTTEKVIGGITVTDEEAEKYYEENKAQFCAGESVNASHILVETEEKAREIYEEIASGKKTFEEAAKEYSTCPSGQAGGNLGDFTRGQMVPEFDRAVFEMAVGEITSEPVQTQFGFHLIKLNSKNEATTTPYAEIADRIKAVLLSEKRHKAYESKVNQLKILYPVEIK